MLINIELTNEELVESGLDKNGLIEHVINTLDASSKELPGYNMNVIIIDQRISEGTDFKMPHRGNKGFKTTIHMQDIDK